jgi:hypothetical protein
MLSMVTAAYSQNNISNTVHECISDNPLTCTGCLVVHELAVQDGAAELAGGVDHLANQACAQARDTMRKFAALETANALRQRAGQQMDVAESLTQQLLLDLGTHPAAP